MSQIKYEVFISYAHRDNKVYEPTEPAWVSELHRFLEYRVGQILGEDIVIWRDDKDMRKSDYFDDVIFGQIKKIPFMICILSPSYNNSKYCLDELAAFYSHAEQSGGVKINDMARIIKVVKTFLRPEDHPEQLQRIEGYEFYQKAQNPLRKELEWREFRYEERAYKDKLEDLARDVANHIRSLRPRPLVAVPTPRAAVYLAETIFDLNQDRDRIKRELQDRNFRILPDEPLPLRSSELEGRARNYMADCKLSVHILGSEYGIIPQGEASRSLERIQIEIAAERFDDPHFARIIWMPRDIEIKEERQKSFIHSLITDSSARKGREVLQSNLEELKSYIIEVFEEIVTPKPAPPAAKAGEENVADQDLEGDDLTRIYLVCDQDDFEYIVEPVDYLYNLGYQPELPATMADEALARETHKRNLETCDAVLIYYSHGNEFWLRAKLDDLKKCFGYGRPRSRPWLAKAIYMTDPITTHKRVYRTRDAFLIQALGSPDGKFRSELLAQFIDQIEGAKGAEKCG